MIHLTLNSGHSRISPRAEVADRVIAMIRPAVRAGGGEISFTGWSIRMLKGNEPGAAGFECRYASRWIISCYMAWTVAGSAEMWQVAMNYPLTAPGLQRPPTVPWLAAAIMPEGLELGLSPFGAQVLFEAGDLERCVAWTVLDTYAPQHGKARARRAADGGQHQGALGVP